MLVLDCLADIFYILAQLACVVRLFVLNDTFNNILVISWRSVLLVEPKPDDPEKTTDPSQVND